MLVLMSRGGYLFSVRLGRGCLACSRLLRYLLLAELALPFMQDREDFLLLT